MGRKGGGPVGRGHIFLSFSIHFTPRTQNLATLRRAPNARCFVRCQDKSQSISLLRRCNCRPSVFPILTNISLRGKRRWDSNVPENRSPEKTALGPLNDLLIYGVGRVVHQHGALLVVEFAVHARVADQVDDPLLAVVLVEAEARGEVSVLRRLVWQKGVFIGWMVGWGCREWEGGNAYLISMRSWILQ